MSSLRDRLVLVSQSPQRSQLLREAGYTFETVTPAFEGPEGQPLHQAPAQHAQALAYFKAASVADRFPDRLLLGADTVVAAGGEMFGKAADRDDARRILRVLTSRPHEVITGVALLAPALDRRVIADAVTRVTMRPMSA
ncbi:MAG: Maf family protein, partial [Phycisphaerae bacterium]|nr:Maf family protein [Phycisphaerae bacterium]